MLRKAPALLEVGAGAEASIHGAGENESSRGTLLINASSAAEALHRRQLLAIGTILAVNGVDLVAQRGEESLGDGVPGLGPVELEDADVAGARGGQVRYADEGLGRGRVVAPQGASGYEGEARRHRGERSIGRCWGKRS